jgi:hypothetical protein
MRKYIELANPFRIFFLEELGIKSFEMWRIGLKMNKFFYQIKKNPWPKTKGSFEK